MAADTETITLDVEGMTCASCALRIERVLGKQDGVADAVVNFAGQEARVTVASEVAVRLGHDRSGAETVKVLFPRSSRAPQEPTSTGASTKPADGPVVLVVDDEAPVRELLARFLGDDGIRTVQAENGETALEILRSRSDVRLVVTDMVMPEMDGRALTVEMRKLYPRLPVLYISGNAGGPPLIRGRCDESAPFLAKPFRAHELLQAVRELLAKLPADEDRVRLT